jgi:ribonuclease VapC
MFVDASALSAILLNEPEAYDLVQKIEAAAERSTSAIAIYEATLAVARVDKAAVDVALDRVRSLLSLSYIQVVSIGEAEAYAALAAHDLFGKGRHPARLNMGDCFAYACARTHNAPLLFKGDDFGQTDIPAA